MKRFRLSLGIIAATIIGSLALITGPAYAAKYWAPGSSPLHVNQGGDLQGRAYGFYEIENTSNGTRSHGEVHLVDHKPGGSGIYIEMQTWINAGICIAPTYTSCTAQYYQGPSDQSARWDRATWSDYGWTLATTGLPASADYARGRVKACEDQKNSPDDCSGWGISAGVKY